MSSVHVQTRLHQRAVEFDVEVDEGEVLAVLGPNGAGKSTLLMLIAGLLRPDVGRIELGDAVVTDTATGTFVPAHARRVAMLSQQAMLFPHMTVAANVAYAPRCRGESRKTARATARRWLTAVGADELADRRPAQLSGGQAQRVAVARALAAEPHLLLLDEPMAALDVTTAPALRRLLREVLRDSGRTAIVVTHDLLDALALADKVVVVDNGRIVESGPARDVLTAPRSDFAARIAGVNLVAGTVVESGVVRTSWGSVISGAGDVATGARAVALFQPAAVAVHLSPPHGSPRNVIAVTIAGIDVHGAGVRVRGTDQPDGATGLAADITAAAAADLDLAPGQTVHFVVKAQEVQVHPASAR
ncbi:MULTISPECIES: sulfate/molybdate ABC transporter ATP-binding protein [Mycolicibacterium]|uniref:ABC transporter-related protein n=1 Tax=Mycolicibacterium vanbaalenii (strain DSM 7251 / JCM 13017 / BCRC 16820 / KCTC 9966 / NRRL B-24157 / PYR-1) TaxID=350058 RepID=A1T847_MYCVP|nr:MULTISPECIES: ATP-binding cassette domain-containing protein [Mycolicibacterium]ABM13347.1 ABC transporter-related protein [Mycolicibacterium vanbaalenii PYR-1]MCV7126810.1 ATP-binding cassette domain-containing protein [Mycolicibacterium vanbaalenii PYR-1]QZY48531.1 ATP-binding cassette domain-containing protein [Mycolicibacterium austroafricanum]